MNQDDNKIFISKNLKISDKSLENAIREILFDSENVINWDKAVASFKRNMPELSAENISQITVDEDKCQLLAEKIINNEISESQSERADEVDIDAIQPDLSQDIPALLYILYGLVDGEDYVIMNDHIMIPTPGDQIWAEVNRDLGN